MKARQFLIHCADNEWGNEVMLQLAKERFAADPTLDIVEVYEHGGWFLAWNRDLVCVGTANDMARLSPEARSFLKKFTDRQYVGQHRRPDEPSYYPCYWPRLASAVA
jgi:GH15 family glucan-1,4-alpha-glucosidase